MSKDEPNTYDDLFRQIFGELEKPESKNNLTGTESPRLPPLVLALPDVNPVLLTSYSEESIELLIQEALLGRIAICIIVEDPDPHNLTKILTITLEPPVLRRIWENRPGLVKCKLKLYDGSIIEEKVGFRGLMIDAIQGDHLLANIDQGEEEPVEEESTEQESREEKATEEEPTEQELELIALCNPSDRNPRLFNDAVLIHMSNSTLTLKEIHDCIIEQEKGRSNIQIGRLKHIVKLDAIKREAKKRNQLKSAEVQSI